MQNIAVELMYSMWKFHNDRLRNDKALVYWKSDNNPKNNNNNNNVGSAWGHVSGSNNTPVQKTALSQYAVEVQKYSL